MNRKIVLIVLIVCLDVYNIFMTFMQWWFWWLHSKNVHSLCKYMGSKYRMNYSEMQKRRHHYEQKNPCHEPGNSYEYKYRCQNALYKLSYPMQPYFRCCSPKLYLLVPKIDLKCQISFCEIHKYRNYYKQIYQWNESRNTAYGMFRCLQQLMYDSIAPCFRDSNVCTLKLLRVIDRLEVQKQLLRNIQVKK